ncbi:MAG: cytochrome b [Pseudomonadota bacterium]|nr:cytochrome b [Pseudomonadota bacterium]
MSIRNTSTWGGVSKALHWLIAALILGQGIFGLVMGDIGSRSTQLQLYGLHKSIGFTILALVVLRLLWRLLAGAPPAVAGTAKWQHTLASATHVALYVLMFVVPISGWVLSSAAGGYNQGWFGLFDVPSLVAQNSTLRDLAGEVHEISFWLLMLLAFGHVAAALYHHLFLNDATLRRMLPGKGER